MNWEETIIHLRDKPEYAEILFLSYLNDTPFENVQRFRNSDEFKFTLDIIRNQFPETKKILEIGSGTGMAAASLALSGYAVTATDPDPSDIVGCGAINKLQEHFHLSDFLIVQTSGEKLPFETEVFDLVYVRQAMHHALDLKKLMAEAGRVLKQHGGFIGAREHIIFNKKDKSTFLETHPLQKWYGGENAYLEEEYVKAINCAGMRLDTIYKHFDSVINFSPMTENEVNKLRSDFKTRLNARCLEKFGVAGRLKFVQYCYRKINEFRFGSAMDERRIPGRMYSFVAHKS